MSYPSAQPSAWSASRATRPRALHVLALAGASLLSPLLPAVRAADDVIARVAGTEIKADQVKPFLAGLSETDREALLKNPAALSQAVRTLILQQLLFKEALAAGWDKTPEVADQIERLKQGVVAESYLGSIAKIPDGYPTEQDVKSLYEARREDLKVPRQLQLAQIYVAVPPDADKAVQENAKARIDAAAKAAKAGDFAAAARESSDERESASRGGAVGWLAEGQIQTEIRTKVAALSKGSVTEPIRLADGWYVVKVVDTKDAHTATLEEVKGQLVRLLQTERARANREAYLAKLQQQNPIALDELALDQLIEK